MYKEYYLPDLGDRLPFFTSCHTKTNRTGPADNVDVKWSNFKENKFLNATKGCVRQIRIANSPSEVVIAEPKLTMYLSSRETIT